MLVSDWMSRDLITVTPEMEVREAARLMAEKGIRRLPVVKGNELLGFITIGDIREAGPAGSTSVIDWDAREEAGSQSVGRIMSTQPVNIGPDAPLEDAAELMRKHKVGSLPVVRDGKMLVGIITQADMMRALEILLGRGNTGTRLSLRLKGQDSLTKALVILRDHGLQLQGLVLSPTPKSSDTRRLATLRVDGEVTGAVTDALLAADCDIVDVRKA